MPRLKPDAKEFREEVARVLRSEGYEVLRTMVDSAQDAAEAAREIDRSGRRSCGVPDLLVRKPDWGDCWIGLAIGEEFRCSGPVFGVRDWVGVRVAIAVAVLDHHRDRAFVRIERGIYEATSAN